MRKTLFLLLITLFIASCSGPIGPQGYDGKDGVGTNWKIIDLVVNSTDWVEIVDANGNNRYYSSHFNMPEITSFVFSSGTVNTFIKTDTNTQQPLPYVRHYENSQLVMWTRTVDYEFQAGALNVFVTASDFAKQTPETMRFKVVLMW